MNETAEGKRMAGRNAWTEDWGKWGTYLSDRQWGTVREDYSAEGDAWNFFPHEHARSRIYRWGEDGLLGWCDADCRLCFAPAFWNGADRMLKERPFGLSNPQGNHGEDLKDTYFYLDNSPTHSFARALYRYPQRAFPYDDLVKTNAARSRNDPEFELVDTGIFEQDRFFDIYVEYAKAGLDDVCIRIRCLNQGPDPAPLWVLPTLWFRNTWSWGEEGATRPEMHLAPGGQSVVVHPWQLPEMHLYSTGHTQWLFTENETNIARLFGQKNPAPYVKDAFHDYLIEGLHETVNPSHHGTKATPLHHRLLQPGEEWEIRLRLCSAPLPEPLDHAFAETFTLREKENEEYFGALVGPMPPAETTVFRRALAGLLWCKKFYFYSVIDWLRGDPTMPPPPESRWQGRNSFWKELHAHDIISMPDSWEYPYFCLWDLMFQSVAFAVVDPATAKRQSMLLRGERYTSPSSQQPAYEWALSDANPPIGGWATWRIYSIERGRCGRGDLAYLKKSFNKLMLAYSWWANRVDQTGDNVFEGGFLGLDNIGVFDRRYPLPDGSRIEQSDGTAWMAAFSLNMLNIAIELAQHEPEYEDIADKFLNDFIYLAASINAPGSHGFSLWDEEDGFYYDVLKRPDGSSAFLKTRSIAGLTPLFAVESFDSETVSRFPLLRRRLDYFKKHRPHLLDQLHHIGKEQDGRLLISLVPPERLRRICERLFDETEFLSPHGIRSLSRYYFDQPYTFTEGDRTETLQYSPADSPVNMFGGNSNWRGPVWMPMNYLLIEALQRFGFYFGESFKMEFPSGSGRSLNLWEISLELQQRLVGIFLPDNHGQRPFLNRHPAFDSPLWRDHILFHEYFHGDTGAGLGASHQTGWSALVAKMLVQLHRVHPGDKDS